MYFKGCDNSKTVETAEESKRIRDNLITLYGEKQLNVCEFPSGKGIYDDKSGKWIDSEEYKKMRKAKPLGVMITKDNTFYGWEEVTRTDQKTGMQYKEMEYQKVNGVEVIKGDPKTGKIEHRFERKKVRI